MAERLTDRTELTTPAVGTDLIYVVDVSDTTDNATGTSKKQTVATFLAGKTFGKNVINPGTPATTLIFNMSNSANHPVTQALTGDFVVFIDNTANRMLIGLALDGLTSFPADLDNDAKFAKYYEGSRLL